MAIDHNAWFDVNYYSQLPDEKKLRPENDKNNKSTPAIIADTVSNNSFKLIPNPAHNSCALFYQIPIDTKATFTMFNAIGQLIQQNEITGTGQLLSIETANLQSGIYLCRVANSTGGLYSSKLVIIK